ncbi:MAG TPA: tetratricopeptide repeat protein [Candidatus Angelobacter sp.]
MRTAATPECPSDDALRRLAAGLTPDDAAPATGDALTTRLLQHASTCDHCGPLLRTYTEIFSDDFTPEEQATLANLRNSSTEWQKNTARQMLETAGTAVKTSADTADTSAADKQSSQQKSFKGSTATTTGRKLFFWKWALVPVSAAVVAVTAFSIWYTQRDTPKKVEALIAQAYTEERPIVLRWPGAAWGQYSVQRGTMFEAKSTSLMQAEIAVGRQTEKTLQETAWIRVVAEKEIIAGHPQIAIPALEQAVRSHPSSAPLLLDLAIAYFGQGEQTHSQESYEKSRDLLGGVLQREPTNTVARFNRALVYERLNAKDKAADDWKTFLKTEKDVHWLAEAQKNLTDLGDLN